MLKDALNSSQRSQQLSQSRAGPRILRAIKWILAWIAALLCTAWAFGALLYDFPVWKNFAAWAFILIQLGLIVFVRIKWLKIGLVFLSFALVLAWWLSLKPRNSRNWQPDVAETAWAEIKGDEVTLHNVRNCDYRSETDYTPRWEIRTVRLSQITGLDIAINFWGSKWMAHPIVSFQFEDASPICFSIETRKEIGESYSAIGGLYRQYELIYLAADERDVLRVRTNYRRGEDVYLYRMALSRDQVRQRFLEYLHTLNALRHNPRWYNAITTNCTTSIRAQHPAAERLPWDWRILVNGKGDELMYERALIVSDALPFPELKSRALVNPVAKDADRATDFSNRIREGRPGFGHSGS